MRESMLNLGDAVVEEGLAHQDSWIAIVEDLATEGLCDEEIATLLRHRDAWKAEALEMKVAGFPYDLIAFHLLNLKATWADVALTFLALGLRSEDMLREILPFLTAEDCWPVVRAAFLDTPEETDLEEVRGVLEYFFPNPRQVFATANPGDIPRSLAELRGEGNVRRRPEGLKEVCE